MTAQIVTGIGFLGAGTTIQVKDSVHGLTTAAGIWSVAAVGVAYGTGLHALAVGATVILLVITSLGRVLPWARPGDEEQADRG